MSNREDWALVIRLACLTEDRTDSEQRAILRLADATDAEFNKQVVTNRYDGPPSRLYDEAQETRLLMEGQKRVELKTRKGLPRFAPVPS